MRGKVVGVFGIFLKTKRKRFGNVAEFVAAQNVTVAFRPDEIIAVIDAGKGDFRQEGRSGLLGVLDLVMQVESVVKIGAGRNVINKGQGGRLDVACDSFGVAAVRLVFHFTVIGSVFQEAHVVAFGEKKKPPFAVCACIEKYVVGQNAGIVACGGRARFGGRLYGGEGICV